MPLIHNQIFPASAAHILWPYFLTVEYLMTSSMASNIAVKIFSFCLLKKEKRKSISTTTSITQNDLNEKAKLIALVCVKSPTLPRYAWVVGFISLEQISSIKVPFVEE
jgi:hypothetical protein